MNIKRFMAVLLTVTVTVGALALSTVGALGAESDVHAHYVCGGNTCIHAGQAHSERITYGTALTESFIASCEWDSEYQNSRLIPAGSYYLTENITLAKTISAADDAEVNICLNGYTIDCLDDMITAEMGATVNICDCTGKGGVVGTHALVWPAYGSTWNIYGGSYTTQSILGNFGYALGGSYCTVTVYGGNFSAVGYDIVVGKDSKFTFLGGTFSDLIVEDTDGDTLGVVLDTSGLSDEYELIVYDRDEILVAGNYVAKADISKVTVSAPEGWTVVSAANGYLKLACAGHSFGDNGLCTVCGADQNALPPADTDVDTDIPSTPDDTDTPIPPVDSDTEQPPVTEDSTTKPAEDENTEETSSAEEALPEVDVDGVIEEAEKNFFEKLFDGISDFITGIFEAIGDFFKSIFSGGASSEN